MNNIIEILLIAITVSISCSILGSLLMLKNMAMISDAISHTILLGIVIGFYIVKDLNSPILIVGAGLVGVITVFIVEILSSSKLLKEDSAIGIVFSLLFSIAVVLISKYSKNIHLDIDSVLLGELAFAPFNRIRILTLSIPKGLAVMIIIFLINLSFVTIFFKELKISVFDKSLALVLGMRPVLIHYMLMSMTSMTAVASFEAVGSILVVAFMIGPPITAYLLTDKLDIMIILSIISGTASSIAGYYIAVLFDISIAGSIVSVIGVLFSIVLMFSPDRGLVTVLIRKKKRQWEI